MVLGYSLIDQQSRRSKTFIDGFSEPVFRSQTGVLRETYHSVLEFSRFHQHPEFTQPTLPFQGR
jgi:hypothetical protein